MSRNNRQLSGDNSRQTVEDLVREGLGYCCLYAFFRVNKRTGLIAARLGVTDRAVRKWKARFKSGELRCTGAANCLLPKLRRAGK